jgi:hypothetical protein
MWTADKLADNKQTLMHGLIGRFLEQTLYLRAWLKELEPYGVVNEAVWGTLDTFEDTLTGKVSEYFNDPSRKSPDTQGVGARLKVLFVLFFQKKVLVVAHQIFFTRRKPAANVPL